MASHCAREDDAGVLVTFVQQKIVLGVLSTRGRLPAAKSFVTLKDGTRGNESGLGFVAICQSDGRAELTGFEKWFALGGKVQLPMMIKALGEFERAA